MRISRMRQVMAIHDCGSFAKAAERLGVAQSSLSKSIARFEDELGVTLIERSSRGSRLTPAGRLLGERARALVEETERLRRDVTLMAGGRPSEVRIGVASALTRGFLPRFTLAAAEAMPDIGLDFEVSPSERLLQLLEGRRVDLVFAGRPRAAVPSGFDFVDVLTAGSVLAVAPGHPLARLNRITLEDLSQHRLCGLAPAHAKAIGAGALVSHYRSNSFTAMLPIVLAGHAAVFAPSFVIGSHVEAGELVVRPCDLDLQLTYSAITNRGAGAIAAIRQLVNVARRCADDL